MKNIISITVAFSLSFLKVYAASGVPVALEQIYPRVNVPLCLGSTVTYRCTTSSSGGGQLSWEYSGDAHAFFADSTDSVGQFTTLGNFEIVLESIDQDGSNYTLISNATSPNGLTVADSEQVLTCRLGSVSESIIIMFAEPIISDVGVGTSTIFWTPPPCNANCTVRVDCEDIATLPCSKGFLSPSVPDLSEKSLLITAMDELSNNSNNTSSAGCVIQCPSVMDTFGLTKNSTSTFASVCGPVSIEHVYNIEDQAGIVYKILEKDSGTEVDFNIINSQIVFSGECGITYMIFVNATLAAVVEPLNCNKSVNHAACGLLISFILLVLLVFFDTTVIVFGLSIWIKKRESTSSWNEKGKDSDIAEGENPDSSGEKDPDIETMLSSFVVVNKGDDHTERSLDRGCRPHLEQSVNAPVGEVVPKDSYPFQVPNPVFGQEQEDAHSADRTPFEISDEEVYSGHNSSIIHCLLSPNAKFIASADTSGSLRVWTILHSGDIQTIAIIECDEDILSLEWVQHKDGEERSTLLLLGTGNGLKLYNGATGDILSHLYTNQDPRIRVLSVASCPKSNLVVFSWVQGTTKQTTAAKLEHKSITKIWDYETEEVISCMAFNHDGTQLVTGGIDGTIFLNTVHEGDMKTNGKWKAHKTSILSVLFDTKQKSAYSRAMDGIFHKWDISQVPVKKVKNHILADTDSEDGKCVASIARRKLLAFTSDHENKYILTFSPRDGKLYEADTFDQVMDLPRDYTSITCIDWGNVDGTSSRCVIGYTDNSVRCITLKYKLL